MLFDYKTYNKILYHGSKGGIVGAISEKSPNKNREKNPCDFGEGFYVGTNKLQAEGVCIEDQKPVLYTLTVDFSCIPEEKILVLTDEQWLFTILACRKKSNRFNELPLAEEIRDIIDSYDIVIGTIADDRMNEAINSFNENNITDKALIACLQYIDYGTQIVFKTPKVNDMITLLSNKLLIGFEAQYIRNSLYEDRKKSLHTVEEMKSKYRREGFFLDEIIEKAERNEISAEDIFPEYYQNQKKVSTDYPMPGE